MSYIKDKNDEINWVNKEEENTRINLGKILHYKTKPIKNYKVLKLEYKIDEKNNYIRLVSNRFFLKNKNKFFLIINNKSYSSTRFLFIL